MTYKAHEAVRVPLPAEGGNAVSHDGLLAASALGGEHVEVVLLAVGLAILLHEASAGKVLAALGAEKVVRVPGPAQGVDTLVTDGAVAIGALGGEEIVEALLAVRAGILLEERGGAKRLAALEAAETLWMPSL